MKYAPSHGPHVLTHEYGYERYCGFKIFATTISHVCV